MTSCLHTLPSGRIVPHTPDYAQRCRCATPRAAPLPPRHWWLLHSTEMVKHNSTFALDQFHATYKHIVHHFPTVYLFTCLHLGHCRSQRGSNMTSLTLARLFGLPWTIPLLSGCSHGRLLPLRPSRLLQILNISLPVSHGISSVECAACAHARDGWTAIYQVAVHVTWQLPPATLQTLDGTNLPSHVKTSVFRCYGLVVARTETPNLHTYSGGVYFYHTTPCPLLTCWRPTSASPASSGGTQAASHSSA